MPPRARQRFTPRSPRFVRGSLYKIRVSERRLADWRENQLIIPLGNLRKYLPGFRPSLPPFQFERTARLVRFPRTLFLRFYDVVGNLVMIPYRVIKRVVRVPMRRLR